MVYLPFPIQLSCPIVGVYVKYYNDKLLLLFFFQQFYLIKFAFYFDSNFLSLSLFNLILIYVEHNGYILKLYY